MKSASGSLWFYTVGRRLPAVFLGFCCLGLTLLGLLVLFSIGRASGYSGNGYFYRQLVWFFLSLPVFAAALATPIRMWRKVWWIGGVTAVILLVIVLIPGIGLKINGARRWVDLGPMNMQVADFARFGFLLFLAGYFQKFQRDIPSFQKGFLYPILWIGLFFGLLLLQPDFGTAVLFATVGGVLCFLAGVKVVYLLGSGMAGLSLLAYKIIEDPVRLKRILSFMDIEGNRADGAYQLKQGLLGFGVGGVGGVGIGNGRQQFSFLPEAHTDFIFPIIGEELGLLATASVLLAFLCIFLIGWSSLRRAPNLFEYIFVGGILFFILLQGMVNMGVATGSLPTKGMSLPFISYGGSNLLVTYIFAGILVRACWDWYRPPHWKAGEIDG